MKNNDAVIYEIKYITTQNINNHNIDKEIPLSLSFSDLDAYIIEENQNKYLIFVLTENNKKLLELYKKYKNDFIKIRLDSYDDLPLNKILCFSVLNILV